MAVPKRKTSKSKRDMRSSHSALKKINISYDKDGNPFLSHNASFDGLYKGRVVFVKKDRSSKKRNAAA